MNYRPSTTGGEGTALWLFKVTNFVCLVRLVYILGKLQEEIENFFRPGKEAKTHSEGNTFDATNV